MEANRKSLHEIRIFFKYIYNRLKISTLFFQLGRERSAWKPEILASGSYGQWRLRPSTAGNLRAVNTLWKSRWKKCLVLVAVKTDLESLPCNRAGFS
ncbi:MAG: hypothetical protein AAGN35_25705 [Bacteroidota bacterium]